MTEHCYCHFDDSCQEHLAITRDYGYRGRHSLRQQCVISFVNGVLYSKLVRTKYRHLTVITCAQDIARKAHQAAVTSK
jgi:hypothetical protein